MKTLFRTLAIALLYALGAQLGLFWALAPSNISIFWPPAGLALAAVLLFGRQALPGIALGALGSNLWTFQAHGSVTTLSLVIATGSTLQALVGARLLKRIALPADAGSAGACLSCLFRTLCATAGAGLIAASIGVPSLHLAGALPAEALALTWATWWLGDFLSVLILTPPVLLIGRGLRREAMARRPILLALSLGAGATVLAFSITWNQETDHIAQALVKDTEDVSNSALLRLKLAEKDVESIARLFDSRPQLSREEFRNFVSSMLKGPNANPALHALSWNPRFDAQARAALERQAWADGLPDFRFTDRNPEGKLVAAAERPEYVAVYYIEPTAGNEAALGFDIASSPARRRAMDLALERRQPIATEPINLVQERGTQRGFLLSMPVFHQEVSLETRQARQQQLQGFAVGVFRIGVLIESSIDQTRPRAIDVYVFDQTLPSGEQLLHAHGSRHRDVPLEAAKDLTAESLSNGLYARSEIEFAGRRWLVQSKPTAAYIAEHRTLSPWLNSLSVLLLGLVVTALLLQNEKIQLADQATRLVQQRLSSSIEALADGFVLYGADDELVLCNERYRQIHASVADLLVPGARIEDILRRGIVRGGYPQSLGQEEVWLSERLRQHRSNATVDQQIDDDTWLRVSARGTPEGGVVGFSVDISELVSAQTELRLALGQAEGATRAKAEFLANMSHEIRTPMNAITGLTYLAQRNNPDPKQSTYLGKISQASKQLLALIDDILDSSKIDAGKLEMEEIDFTAESVLDRLADTLSLKADEKGLELLFDIEPGLPTHLVGDPLRLGQVLLNLGGNAVKFTEGGQVIISVARRPQDSTSQHTSLEFSVKDSGLGMSPEQCAALFQPFSQADATITRKYGGTGLGLSIAKSLVELMGGRIWAESTLGKGSVFRFTARFRTSTKASLVVLRSAEQLQGQRVLIVDDNAEARSLHLEMASSFGMQAQAAEGGEQAVKILEEASLGQQCFDLLLLDWKMPGMDGIELLQHIQQLKLSESPKIVMATGYRREELLEELRQSAVDCAVVLSKPVTPLTLFNALMRAVQTSGQANPGDGRVWGVARTPHDQQDEIVSQPELVGKRVLLVEDNDSNRELATELLRIAGVVVTVAVDGQRALETLARERAFDAVLMDCHMPVMDGYHATIEIRKNPSWAKLPIIGLTADAMKGTKEKVLAAGMNDYLTKPVEVAKLYGALSRWMPSEPESDAQPEEVENEWVPRRSSIVLPAQLPGLDQAAGLRACAGLRDLYVELLSMFLQGQSDFCERFDAARVAADPTAAHRCAHSLKGEAGNIGAKAVVAAAAELEGACSDQAPPDRLDELRDRVVAELKPVLAGLAKL